MTRSHPNGISSPMIAQAFCVLEQVAEGLQIHLVRDIGQPLTHFNKVNLVVLPHRRVMQDIPGADSRSDGRHRCHYYHAHQQDFPSFLHWDRPLSDSIIRGAPRPVKAERRFFQSYS